MSSTKAGGASHQEADGGLSQSDLQARRLLDIVLTLLGSSQPVSSTRLRELHYPDARPDSFRKLFSRDRERLALCGIVIRRTNRPPDEPLWEIDKAHSFAPEGELTPREAVILDVACAQLASDPSFPLANDLRMALAKVDRIFDRRSPQASGLPPAKNDRRLATIEECLLSHHAVDIGYRRPSGEVTSRCLLPYGLFSLGGQSYVVGPQADGSGFIQHSKVQTYRVERIVSIKERKDITYVIPEDFNINDYVLLPFQVGKPRYYAEFVSLDNDLEEYGSEHINNASVIHSDNLATLRIAVANESLAASWAIEQSLVPISPSTLVTSWTRILRSSLESAKE